MARQAEWSVAEAWRDLREHRAVVVDWRDVVVDKLTPYVVCGGDKGEVERNTKALIKTEAEILEAEAELNKHRRYGPFVRISPIFSESRLARGKQQHPAALSP